jgi:hypothetical protein
LFAALAAGANAAESGLIGIKLFDSGVTVVKKFGNPDDIQAVNIGGGGSAGGPGAMGGGAPGGPMGPGAPGGRGPGGKQMPGAAGASQFSFGDWVLRQGLSGMPSARPGAGGDGGNNGFGPPAGGGGGMPPSAGGGSAESATFTRWVYNRSGSKYGFIIDKKGRVVQIEAVGLANGNVRTSKGVSFGDTFAEVIKKYNTPDGYDISGSNVMARYLTRNKVAFRFSKLGANKPQVVTGIVVAAGKG